MPRISWIHDSTDSWACFPWNAIDSRDFQVSMESINRFHGIHGINGIQGFLEICGFHELHGSRSHGVHGFRGIHGIPGFQNSWISTATNDFVWKKIFCAIVGSTWCYCCESLDLVWERFGVSLELVWGRFGIDFE